MSGKVTRKVDEYEIDVSVLFNKRINEEIDYLKKYYQFRRPKEIKEFLKQNEELISFLSTAHSKIKEFFPTGKLVLEILNDYNENWQELIIWVKTKLSPQKSYKTLKKLDNDWWLSESRNLKANLTINLDLE